MDSFVIFAEKGLKSQMLVGFNNGLVFVGSYPQLFEYHRVD